MMAFFKMVLFILISLNLQYYLYCHSLLSALPVVEKAVEGAENVHFVYVGIGDRD
jgi:hypothetical protein